LNHEVERQCQEIDDAVMHAMPNFNIDNIPEEVQRHMIFDSLSGRGQLYVETGFMEDEINQLYQMVQPFCVSVCQPGPTSQQLAGYDCVLPCLGKTWV
jgi:hypothetical protein